MSRPQSVTRFSYLSRILGDEDAAWNAAGRKGLNSAAFLALLLLRHPQQPFTEVQSNLMVLFICERLQPADL